MQCVIMAAGFGTRLEPVTNNMSKVMVPVANKPLLEWVFGAAKKVSKDVFIIARRDQKDVIDFFSGRAEFIYQDKPLGTADAIGCCKEFVDGKFLLLSGDGLATESDLKEFSSLGAAAIASFPVKNPSDFGVVGVENGIVKAIEEKPASPKSNLANCGIYIFDDSIFDAIKKTNLSRRNEYEITDSLRLLDNGIKNFTLSKWATITYPWDILDANSMVLDQFGSQISKNAEIRPGSCIEEPVAIGNSVIGPNCYIRKHSSIGNNCKVGNAVEIKNSIIMDNSFVSHLSYVGDSIVGRNVNIGAGAIFANLRLDEKTVGMNIKGEKIDSGRKKLGAIVGDNVKLGVNVTIMPGKKIWPNIMVPACYKVEDDITKQIPLK